MNKKTIIKIVPIFFSLFINCNLNFVATATAGVAEDIAVLPIHEWYEISNSDLNSVAYDWGGDVPTKNGIGFSGVVTAWNGGVVDTIYKRLLIFGGGHKAYGGNEIYGFNFDSDSNPYTWQRLTTPSSHETAESWYAGNDCSAAYKPHVTGLYSDNKPASRHTYNHLIFYPPENQLIPIGMKADYSPNACGRSKAIHAYDFDKNSWSLNLAMGGEDFMDKHKSVALDPSNNHIWVFSGLKLYEYDGSSWTQRSGKLGQPDLQLYNMIAIDPTKKLLVRTGGADATYSGNGTYQVFSIDPADYDLNGYAPSLTTSCTGPKDALVKFATLDFDSNAGKFVSWIGGTTVYQLSVADDGTSVWTETAGTGDDPGEPTDAGMYGRWSYVPSINAFVAVTSTGSNVFIYKFSADSETTSAITPDSKPTLQVGSGKKYATIFAALQVAKDGYVIEVDAETYVTNWKILPCITQDNLTIRGVGGLAVLQYDDPKPIAKVCKRGLITINGANNVTLENLQLEGAWNGAHNAAGIKNENSAAGDLTVRNCIIKDNDNGIQYGASSTEMAATVTVENTELNNNSYDGHSHNIYVGHIAQLNFRYNWTHSTKSKGHLLKSRATVNYIEYNRITGEDSTCSYMVDIPCGGTSYVIGNLIHEGVNSDNAALLAYGMETNKENNCPDPQPPQEVYVINNTFVEEKSASKGYGYYIRSKGTPTIIMRNNIFYSSSEDQDIYYYKEQAPIQYTNLHVRANPGLNDVNNYDYSLTASAAGAINQGSDPGFVHGYNLTPAYNYAHPLRRTFRSTDGNIDIGAYEFPTNYYLKPPKKIWVISNQ